VEDPLTALTLWQQLGGAGDEDDGSYKLGDDALEVLRDIKKWIRFYDQKTNRMDVARCLSEANLVSGDLLPILATWMENDSDNRFKARIALACYEVLTPLTWPIERSLETMTVNHHRHLPVLQLSQLGYKRDVVNFDGAQILHTAVRVALPSLAVPIGDRTLRDHGVIKLVLYFIRNIAMISVPPGVKFDEEESQISRSATIDAFSYQDIFLTLLTVASNMGEDFRTEDVILMEIIFHLVKRVDISKLFLTEKQLNKTKDDELVATMKKEAAMLKSFNGRAPTRHNRFGTMIWVKREDGKMSTVSGQAALIDKSARERKMDNTKTFRPPKRARRADMEDKDLGPPVSLDARANGQLRNFVEEFLDSGFNPLFQHLRKTIDREAEHVLHHHRGQFFYLVAWFLEAERARANGKKTQQASQGEVNRFSLVAGVLNQEMFISLNRALDRAHNDKDWQELATVMRCFTQILLTVQEMAESGNEENEEIAENILNRLFYEEATHDAVANLVRNYKDQGFEYLDACTELTHTYLRILEAYSKQNVDLQVRSRKRSRRKKKAAKAADGEDDTGPQDAGDDSADDEENAQKTSSERKFDFKRFALRFVPQGVVDTFIKFTRYYKDLNDAQLKRAHRYFYRVAFKQEMSVMLFRVDIIHLFYNMIKGPDALDTSSPMRKEWEELVKQIIRRCTRKIEERPALIIELLFSKINSTAHYLEYGFEKQTVSTNPKAAAELEFRHILERDKQVGVAVGALLDKSQQEHIDWVKKQLTTAESHRRAWEDMDTAMSAGTAGFEESLDKMPAGVTPKGTHFCELQSCYLYRRRF
jgi:replication fork protection complex subunit Tof1/Swi1